MEARELRIGNYIGYKEVDLNVGQEIIKQYQCTINDIAEIERGNICNRYSPIPLTEEWLVRFGFEVYEFDHKASQYRHGNRLLVIRDDNCFYDYGADVNVKYVHQLQNLYFSLTNEELTIN